MATHLTDDEQRVFFDLLGRVCEHHVDHFLLMKVETSDGPCFVQVSFRPSGDPDAYTQVTPDSRLAVQ
jgi:hypothetical protein